jgi:small subunit ribosomal protein S20
MRTYIKRVRSAVAAGENDSAKEHLEKAVSAIGRAASRGVIHRNTAARYISRLTKTVNKAA